MENQSKNFCNFGLKTVLFFGLIFAFSGCAQKPVLKQVSDGAPETPINSPAQADSIVKMHSK
jgi:hypothetical protein